MKNFHQDIYPQYLEFNRNFAVLNNRKILKDAFRSSIAFFFFLIFFSPQKQQGDMSSRLTLGTSETSGATSQSLDHDVDAGDTTDDSAELTSASSEQNDCHDLVEEFKGMAVKETEIEGRLNYTH